MRCVVIVALASVALVTVGNSDLGNQNIGTCNLGNSNLGNQNIGTCNFGDCSLGNLQNAETSYRLCNSRCRALTSYTSTDWRRWTMCGVRENGAVTKT